MDHADLSGRMPNEAERFLEDLPGGGVHVGRRRRWCGRRGLARRSRGRALAHRRPSATRTERVNDAVPQPQLMDLPRFAGEDVEVG
ncbi:hypothetical protein E4A41_08400, partial [Micrococcus endophyticus]